MRTFELHRDVDETGISGTGMVAQGIEFDDRTAALRWLTDNRSTAVYGSMADVEKIHGHGGKTRIVYTGDPYRRGMTDCTQDFCESAPFNCAGGLEARHELKAPKWIAPREAAEWLEGYKAAARGLFGDDWATCEFGWQKAITIGGDK